MVLPIDSLSKIQIKIQGPLQIIKRFLDLCMVDNIGKQCFSLFPIRHYPSYFSFYFRFPIQPTYKLHSQLRSYIQLAALLGCDEIIKFKELFKSQGDINIKYTSQCIKYTCHCIICKQKMHAKTRNNCTKRILVVGHKVLVCSRVQRNERIFIYLWRCKCLLFSFYVMV